MKCPYCEKEMQSGYIPTDNTPAQWLPDGKRQSLLKIAYAKDCIRIVEENGILGHHAKADYCDKCGIILLREER
jgi:hypothetical protein